MINYVGNAEKSLHEVEGREQFADIRQTHSERVVRMLPATSGGECPCVLNYSTISNIVNELKKKKFVELDNVFLID